MKHRTVLDRIGDMAEVHPCLYVRVSTGRQAKEGFSLERQVEMGREAIKRYKLKCKGDVRVFEDAGITGTMTNRKAYQLMMDSIRSGDVNLVIVTTTDRVGRELLNNIEFRRFVIEQKTEMLFLHNPSLDIYSIEGEFIYTLDSLLGQREVRIIRSRTVEGIIQSFENGNYASPGKPYGYNKVSKKLYVNEKQAAVVKLIHQLYLMEEFNVSQVVEYLKINEIDTSVKWDKDKVRRLLRNLTYCDIIVRDDLFRTFTNKGIAPILIDLDTKVEVIALLKQRSRGRSRKNKHIFQGKVYCKDCDRRANNDTCKKVYRYYVCKICKTRISEVSVDEYVSEQIISRMAFEYNEATYKKMLSKLKGLDQRKETIYQLYEKELITSASWKREHKVIRQERRLYLQSIGRKVNNSVSWYDMKLTVKQKIVSKKIEKIIVDF